MLDKLAVLSRLERETFSAKVDKLSSLASLSSWDLNLKKCSKLSKRDSIDDKKTSNFSTKSSSVVGTDSKDLSLEDVPLCLISVSMAVD